MYETILLPTDGSTASLIAADHAGSLAALADSTVHVISVADGRNRFNSPSSGIAPDVWKNAEHEHAVSATENAIERMPDDIDTEQTITEGIPHESILEIATDESVDAVVMGTHGRTGLDHYLVGSVTERVVRHSPVPVITVRESTE
jgi:nucleotide-binding universal stress UspA family protein